MFSKSLSPFVYPFLTYCNVAWSSTYCSSLNCIYLLQKRLVRLITKAHYLANTAPLFSQLKVLDIFSINSFSVTTFMYCYHHNLLPSSFRAGYSKTSGEHWTIEIYKNQWASGVTICLLIFLAMEEHESQVLQVECSMECSLLGEQEQSHSAGTDIVHGRWYLL